MSVINSMLRDLDRRHAPMPLLTNVQATAFATRRRWPRSAFALCALIIVVGLSWHHAVKKNFATTRREYIPVGSEAASMPLTVAANEGADRLTTESAARPAIDNQSVAADANSAKKLEADRDTSASNKINYETKNLENSATKPIAMINNSAAATTPEKKLTPVEQPAPIFKQERKNPDALNDERYQLARAALSQGQPQRAYELLRNDPPPISTAVDYHAVLAALEQQLGHYSDASARYQQLLSLDQNQASWWLGLGLSFDGEHRNVEALAAYRQAAALNALPEAAQQYIAGRIAALGK